MKECPYCYTEATQEERGDSHAIAIPSHCPKCFAWELHGYQPNHPLEKATGWRLPGIDCDAQDEWLVALVETVWDRAVSHMLNLMDPLPGCAPADSLAPIIKFPTPQQLAPRA